MMTASSIASAGSAAYAEYLDAKASRSERGDYYLGRDGLPAEAPGQWHAPAEALRALGIDPGAPVGREALEALMEGRAPSSSREDPVWLRAATGDGTRAAGLDVTFSAPKSVSIAWALSSRESREAIEAAHRGAVGEALGHLQETVPTIKAYQGRGLPAKEVTAAGLLTAEFLHTTARGVDGGTPDPQLHSHCVITSAIRADGSIAAVRSRPVFRAAREVGAYYRAALASRLGELGYELESSTGKSGRYFELAGVGETARAVFSKRTEEVKRAAAAFRAERGRAPERGELREMKLASRQAKQPRTRGELDTVWRETAAEVGLGDARRVDQLRNSRTRQLANPEDWEQHVEAALTETRATFSDRELRAAALEQAPGRLPAAAALEHARQLRTDGIVLALQSDGIGEVLTTARLREREQRALDGLERLAGQRTVRVGERHRTAAGAEVHERLGAPMSKEQTIAHRVLTGPERAAVLIGPAGTGKGVLIDAVARAERSAGRRVLGVAVAGSTAERLGRDSPALEGNVANVDALLARVDGGRLPIDINTTVIFDEAGMADTDRLQRLTAAIEEHGGKLVLVGDARQLASIGPGGLFARAGGLVPVAELSDVRRTQDPEEQEAWRQLRAGEPERAMAHYRGRGQLHMSDTRDQALEGAVRRYDALTLEHGIAEVALMSDGSNVEIDRMNARAQHLRRQRDELGERELELPDAPYALRAGDRVMWTAPQLVAEQARVENGSRGDVLDVDPKNGSVRIQLDGTRRSVSVQGEDLASLKLAYAQHLYRQQGATVRRAVSLTGGWQTSREGAYVQASRARAGTDWYVAREDLGDDGEDAERIDRLAAAMRVSGAQIPSVRYALRDELDIAALTHHQNVDRGRPRSPVRELAPVQIPGRDRA